MSVFADILGDKIQGKNGDMDVAELVGEGKVVALYFSAHWCPPCRAFTPQLAEWYKKFKDGENASKFDIVFVSSDRDQGGFDEYYKDMPWLALPFSERDKKASLSRKFKVTGIPTLIIINAKTAKVISSDGRSIVTEDPEGKEFPWAPKGFLDILTDGALITDADGTEMKWKDVKCTHLGLYFSAHWCGPCRSFTPQLIETYKIINEESKQFEIIFVSSDKDEDSFIEYYEEMPWLSLKFKDERKKTLSRIFDVSGIPSLIILDLTTGETITNNGRGAVEGDPNGQQFPWHPKPVEELKSYTAAAINEQPALVWLTDESEEESKKALEIMAPIAKEYLDEVGDLDADEKLVFLYSGPNTGQDDIGSSLRGFLKIPADRDPPILFATNIPDQEKYICEEEEITAEVIQKVVKAFKTKRLDWQPIQ